MSYEDPIYLSIVIPAYNEAKRLPKTLSTVFEYLQNKPYQYEIIIVDDGSSDGTSDYVKSHPEYKIKINLLRSDTNHGKGASVRKGMLESKGEFVIFLDADGATQIDQIEKLMESISNGYDIAIGSRGLSDSRVNDHFYRRILGYSFNIIVKFILVKAFNDTQCGFKLFKKNASDKIFGKTKINGFGFDVEVLFLAQKLSLRVQEVPIIWNSIEGSKIIVFIHAPIMFFEVLMIKLNDLFHFYDKN